MTNQVMMQLGDYQFSLGALAYESLEKVSGFRWSEQKRLSQKPGQQFIGEGGTRIRLAGKVFPHYRGGLGQVENLKAEARKGEPLALVDGLGKILGDFVILEFTETHKHLTKEGLPSQIDFNIDIREY